MVSERENSVVVLYLPIESLKSRAGREPILVSEPRIYQPINICLSYCAIEVRDIVFRLLLLSLLLLLLLLLVVVVVVVVVVVFIEYMEVKARLAKM